jgi:hypothetical protein
MWSTIKTNWRDIALFIGIGLVFAFVADWIIYMATLRDATIGLASVINYMKGFSLFVGANLAAALIGVTTWPTINSKFNQDGQFRKGWESLGDKGQVLVYIGLIQAQALVAAICFAAA